MLVPKLNFFLIFYSTVLQKSTALSRPIKMSINDLNISKCVFKFSAPPPPPNGTMSWWHPCLMPASGRIPYRRVLISRAKENCELSGMRYQVSFTMYSSAL